MSQTATESPARPAGVDFVIYPRPYGLQAWQTSAWLRTDAGLEREATPEEVKLYQALAAAQARVGELEAQAEAHGRKKR